MKQLPKVRKGSKMTVAYHKDCQLALVEQLRGGKLVFHEALDAVWDIDPEYVKRHALKCGAAWSSLCDLNLADSLPERHLSLSQERGG